MLQQKIKEGSVPLVRTHCPNFGHLPVKLKSQFLHGTNMDSVLKLFHLLNDDFFFLLCHQHNSRIHNLGHFFFFSFFYILA